MVPAVLSMGLIGLAFGCLLGFAARRFAVEVDERQGTVRAALPGANCGACGYPGCDGLAAAIVAGKAGVDGCPVGGASVAARIARIMGVAEPEAQADRMVARVLCQGGKEECPDRFEYVGIRDCGAASLVAGGPKGCTWGCLGFDSCLAACKFGAIYRGGKGLPVVLSDRCTGCGNCVKACPRGVIKMVPTSVRVHILCNSKDRGPVVRRLCKVGCIACQACVKACPEKAIAVAEHLAVKDYGLCRQRGKCVEKCPTGAIVVENPVATAKAV